MLNDREQLTVGRSYVHEKTQTAFEVIELRDYKVTYKAYDLATNELCIPPLECNRFDFLRMVDRAATSAEIAGLQSVASAPGRGPDLAKK